MSKSAPRRIDRVGGVLAGFRCGWCALSPALGTQPSSRPDFSPNGRVGWIAYGPEFIALPSGPRPVTFDPAHPFVPNAIEILSGQPDAKNVSENSTYSTHMEQGTDAMEREKMFLFASREGKFLNHLEDALKRIE